MVGAGLLVAAESIAAVAAVGKEVVGIAGKIDLAVVLELTAATCWNRPTTTDWPGGVVAVASEAAADGGDSIRL